MKQFTAPQNRLSEKPEVMHAFVLEYATEFAEFVSLFEALIQKANTDKNYQRVFSFLGISAVLYPLMIALESRKWMDEEILKLFEIIDMRICKVQDETSNTSLCRHALSRIKTSPDKNEAVVALKEFLKEHGSDNLFSLALETDLYKNFGTKYLLWEYQAEIDLKFDRENIGLFADLEVEHMFAQEPNFNPKEFGFDDEKDYATAKNRIGNLSLLESGINKTVSNEAPTLKAKGYNDSKIPEIRQIGFQISNHGFRKENLGPRGKKIQEFSLRRWPLNQS